MKEKGFTLIELLAVILILGVIALIAVPVVNKIIETSKKSSFKDSVINASKAADYKVLYDDIKGTTTSEVSIYDLIQQGRIKGKLISGKYKIEEEKIIAEYVSDGIYCAYGEIDNLAISKDCNKLDSTGPSIEEAKLVLTSTSKSIKVTLASDLAKDIESGISSYTLSISPKAQDSVNIKNQNEYTFKDLNEGTEYTISVYATNGNEIKSTTISKKYQQNQ
ncbi:MAG TPA: fibronectin type III domain-containing protein [Bacilli bacterium]|nr:fibronectin type III domain-containing protein [Bacilli bacterium]